MFDLQLLNYDPSTPTYLVILITALSAFFLGSLIAVTYEYTTMGINKRAHFMQSLTLIGIGAATVMQAIGDSVALGLGILGALSIIRFRTVLNDPRNITFMFAALASGIGCGVFGLEIALIGTLVFCSAAVILRFSPWKDENELIGQIRLYLPKNKSYQSYIENILKLYCRNFELEQIRFLNQKKVQSLDGEGIIQQVELSGKDLQEITYLFRLKSKKEFTDLTQNLNELEDLKDLKLAFKKLPKEL